MASLTEAAAARLDELYTTNPPEVDQSRQGFFARQKGMTVNINEFTARYLTAKSISVKQPLDSGGR